MSGGKEKAPANTKMLIFQFKVGGHTIRGSTNVKVLFFRFFSLFLLMEFVYYF